MRSTGPLQRDKGVRKVLGRPAVVEAPWDVLGEPATLAGDPPKATATPLAPKDDEVDDAAKLILMAKNPLIVVGAGALEAAEEVRRLARLIQAPVTSHRSGRGIVPPDDFYSLRPPIASGKVRSRHRDRQPARVDDHALALVAARPEVNPNRLRRDRNGALALRCRQCRRCQTRDCGADRCAGDVPRRETIPRGGIRGKHCRGGCDLLPFCPHRRRQHRVAPGDSTPRLHPTRITTDPDMPPDNFPTRRNIRH